MITSTFNQATLKLRSAKSFIPKVGDQLNLFLGWKGPVERFGGTCCNIFRLINHLVFRLITFFKGFLTIQKKGLVFASSFGCKGS